MAAIKICALPLTINIASPPPGTHVPRHSTFAHPRHPDTTPLPQVHTFLATVPEFRGKSRHGLYGDSILELDWAVGEILGELRRLGMEDNTLVYLTSDNGGHLEERGAAGDVQGGYNGELKGTW